jgi:hypothetical protein
MPNDNHHARFSSRPISTRLLRSDNRFTLSLLKQHPGKLSIVMKRRSCGWNERFLLEVLTATTL